jgi:CDP-paratose 2-epimerase
LKLLLTGICGFAGNELARGLLVHREGLTIIGIDNLSRKGSAMNIEGLRALGIDLRIVDVRDRAALAELPECNAILDCAANPSVLAGLTGSESRDLVDQNLYGTVNLLELCREWSASFALLSTSRVYSIPALASLPLVESATRFEISGQVDGEALANGYSAGGVCEGFSTRPPVSLYGSTKLCSEALALEYGQAFGFPVWINRCGVLAGAGQFGKADQGIFSYWIHSWRAGRPLRYIGFNGSGKQVRDCLHPQDLIPLISRQFDTAPDGRPQIINVAGGISNSMSLMELSAWCRENLGPSATESAIASSADEIMHRPYDIPWLVLDHDLATRTWGWHPTTPISSILNDISAHACANPDWLEKVC